MTAGARCRARWPFEPRIRRQNVGDLGRRLELIARKPWRHQVRPRPGLPRHLGTCCSFRVDPGERPSTGLPEHGEVEVLVVLGCRVRRGQPSRTLESRLELTWQLARERYPGRPIVVSGGRPWEGHREADVMAEWLVKRGASRENLILEAESLTTLENARKVAALLTTRGWQRVGLVTSDFHVQRAVRLFRDEGAVVRPFAARSDVGFFTALRLRARELGAHLLGRFESR